MFPNTITKTIDVSIIVYAFIHILQRRQQQARHLVNIAQDSAWLDMLASIMNFGAADAHKTQLVTLWHLGRFGSVVKHFTADQGIASSIPSHNNFYY